MRFVGNVEQIHASFPALMTRRFLWFAAISLAHVWLFAWLLHGRIVQQTPPQDALTIWTVPAVARLLPEATKHAPKPASKKSQDYAPKKPVNPDLKVGAVNLPLSTEPSPNVSPLEAKPEAETQTETPTSASLNLATTGMWKALEKEAPARGRFLPQPAKDSFLTFQKNVAAAGPSGGQKIETFTLTDGTRITKVSNGSFSYCAIAAKANGVEALRGRDVRVVNCGGY